MAKIFACKDIGMACEFQARAENEQELLAKIAEHAKTAHNMQQIDAVTQAKVRSAIKDA